MNQDVTYAEEALHKALADLSEANFYLARAAKVRFPGFQIHLERIKRRTWELIESLGDMQWLAGEKKN